MANIRQSEIQWNLTYKGEVMYSPIFHSYEDVKSYIENAPSEQRDDYKIIRRVVVTEIEPWEEWG